MSVCAPLVPAEGPMAGVPVYAQSATPVQSTEPQQPASIGKSRGKGKYKLTRGRRAQNDTWPGFSGNEPFDVERLWLWVGRGAHKPSQRMCTWKGDKMDVEQAYRLMQDERRALELEQQRLERLKASATLPHVAYGMPQPADCLQEFGLGYQNLILPDLQAPAPAQQGPFTTGHSSGDLPEWVQGYQGSRLQQIQANMPAQQSPVSVLRHADSLQGQSWGYQGPHLQQLQVSQPAAQLPLHADYGAGFLPAFPQQYNPGFSRVTEGLQSQSSSSGSPSHLDLYADNSNAGVSWGSSQSSLPFAPHVTEGLPNQFFGGTSEIDFTAMGAWNHQPALDIGSFLPLNIESNNVTPLEGPGFDLEDIPPLGGAGDLSFEASLLLNDRFF